MSAKNEVDVKQSRRRRRKQKDADEENELAPGQTEAKGRATPSRRKEIEKTTKSSGNFVTRLFRGVFVYLDGVRGELAKVTWPTREQALELTRIVLIACVVASLVLGLISLFFTEVFRLGLDYPIIMVVIVVLAVGALLYYMWTSNRRTSTY
jgi:preprotein translocase subunit SecE